MATQRIAIMLAFIAAALSLGAVGVGLVRDGSVSMTPLLGGLLMLALGIGGYRKLKRLQ